MNQENFLALLFLSVKKKQ